MEKVQLTLDGHPAGECDADTFELAKLYLAEGRTQIDVVRELKASGIGSPVTIVVNAKRALELEKE